MPLERSKLVQVPQKLLLNIQWHITSIDLSAECMVQFYFRLSSVKNPTNGKVNWNIGMLALQIIIRTQYFSYS